MSLIFLQSEIITSEVLKAVSVSAGLAGLGIFLCLVIFREIIRKTIFPRLTKQQGSQILNRLITLTAVVTIISILAYTLLKVIPLIQGRRDNGSVINITDNRTTQIQQSPVDLKTFRDHAKSTNPLPLKSGSNANTEQNNNDLSLGERTRPYPVENCPDPPATAVFNYWPVSYKSPIVDCRDFPTLDGKLVGTDHYSQSEEASLAGLTAHAGDTIYIAVYINNGAADNSEEENPGFGIARNVIVSTEVDSSASPVHYISVKISADNAKAISDNFKITTNSNERVELVPLSGELFNPFGQIIHQGFNTGNNSLILGDIAPTFADAVFIRYKIKVT